MSDTDLIYLVGKGVEDAFKELLKRHQGAIYQFACRFLADSCEAEDIAQETFLRLYRFQERYIPGSSLRNYLLKITQNLCIDLIRKKSSKLMEMPEMTDNETSHDCMERVQSLNALEKAISDLPENQRAVILLRHDHHLRYKEIAQTLGISVGAVESLLVRARRKLRSLLLDDS